MIGVEWLSWLIQDTKCSSLCLAVDVVELIESRTPSTIHLCIAIGVDWFKNTKYSTSLHCYWCWLIQEHQVQYIFALLLVLIDSRTPRTVHLCIVIGVCGWVDWFINTKCRRSLHCNWCGWVDWFVHTKCSRLCCNWYGWIDLIQEHQVQ